MRAHLIAALGAAALMAWSGMLTAQTSEGMTLDQVDPVDPFGEIDVTLTMLDPKTIDAWANGLEADRQAELRNRCQIMLDNPGWFDIAARAFCRTLLEG